MSKERPQFTPIDFWELQAQRMINAGFNEDSAYELMEMYASMSAKIAGEPQGNADFLRCVIKNINTFVNTKQGEGGKGGEI